MTIGFYGTLPMHADLVSGNLPAEFLQPWQTWLQQALTSSREQLGTAWLNCYLTTPIWRFILSENVCGKQAWAGILMPCVSKTGHYFPLTIASPAHSDCALPHLLTLGHAWFEQLEEVALSGLEDNLDLTQFIELLNTIPKFSIKNSVQSQVLDQDTIQIRHAEPLSEAFVELNASLLTLFLPQYSLWRMNGSEQDAATLSLYQGLPSVQQFTSFLSSTSVVIEDKTEPLTAWTSWAATDIGHRRQINEDAILNKPEACLWAIADGMGGHKAGDVASQLIINALDKLNFVSPLYERVVAITQCLQQVNSELKAFAQREYGQHIVGSTVVILICEARHCAVLWAGDSRLYRLRNHQLEQLTQDHSVKKQFSNIAVLTNAVGAADSLKLDCVYFDVQPNDLLLLSSDGLDKELSLTEIADIMQTSPPQNIVNRLINKTLERGARDNVSVIAVYSGD